MRSRSRRKLLIASIGVAAVSYACEKKEPVGNVVAPTQDSAEPPPTAVPEPVGNLVAPEPIADAGTNE